MGRRSTHDTYVDDVGTIVEAAFSGKSIVEDDVERQYLIVPAPNAIEWIVGKQYCNVPSLFEMTRQYQVIRDYFQLRCPICNKGTSEEGQQGDCWGKSRAYLESEVLLTWHAAYNDDACPRCKLTRTELVTDGLLHAYNQFHLVCGQRCVSLKSTYLFTENGLVRMGELVEEAPVSAARDLSLSVADRQSVAKANSVVAVGEKPVKRVRTTRGFRLDVSAEHRFLVTRPDLSTEWVQADELQVGDALRVSVGTNLFGNRHLELYEARILGYLIANGDVTDVYKARFEHGHYEVCDLFVEDLTTLRNATGLSFSWLHTKAKDRDKDADLVEISGKAFVEWFRALGVGPHRAEQKEVPVSVRQGDRETILEFLGAFISCDGCAGLHSSGRGYVKPRICFFTVSPELSMQLRLLLLNLGIVTNTSESATRGFRSVGFTGTTTYFSSIAIESVELFCKLIHLTADEKTAGANDCLEYIKTTTRKQECDGPAGSAIALRALLREIDIAHGGEISANNRVVGSVCNRALGSQTTRRLGWTASQGQSTLTKDLALEVLERCGSLLSTNDKERLQEYADPNFLFVRVIEVEDGDESALMGDISVPSTESFVANGIVTHNSGKSITAALMTTYIEHRVLSLAHSFPGGFHAFLGIPASELFEITVLASNEVQGLDTIWGKYRGFRSNSPWFQRYVPWIKAQEANQLTPIGMEQWCYKEIDKKIINQHPSCRLIINSLNSNSSGLRGRTRIMASADELAHMQQTDSKLSADEVYVGLENSLRTVRSRAKLHGRPIWLGSMVSVSSPVSRDDKSMKLMKMAEHVDGMFAAKYATWEFNPFEPRENFDDEYMKDPVRAERDFGANPPTAAHPLIDDISRFRRSVVDDSLKPTADLVTRSFTDPQGQEYVAVVCTNATIATDAPRYVCFDAGRNFDAFAAACAHGEVHEAEDGSRRIITVYDWVMRILPMRGTEVHFDSVYDLVKKLKEKQTIVRCEFDHWQSFQLVQQIRQLGVRAEAAPTKNEDYKRFVRDAYTGMVRMLPPGPGDVSASGKWLVEPPQMSPTSCAIYELEGLERDPDTDKISNPRKGEKRGWSSNDVAQVCVHVHRLIQEQGYVEREDDRSRRAALKRSEAEAAQYTAHRQGKVFNPSRVMGGASKYGPGGRGW